ncbi:MAG TPA: hypothetical protein VJP04_05795 [Terriglobales bacterium]|nr:hypothetical protein [Terriglobales bacterium]
MPNRKVLLLLLVLCLSCATTAVLAQQGQQPLTNADVVKMVKSGLPASVISNAIQANDTDFDVSANGLIALQKAGVPQAVMDAMISASSKKRGSSAASSAAPAAAAAPAATLPNGGQLAVTVAQGGKSAALPLQKTQLAQTKSKASSMGALATDSAVNQAFQVGVNEAAWQAWSHGGGYGTYSGVTAGASVMSGIMGHRKPTVTYVWALPGPSAGNALENSPNFDVTFTGIPGINEEEYEPAIVKLTPTSNNWRLVGASQGKADTMQDSSANWEVYSSYVEEKVPVRVNKLGSGHVQISPASPLAVGQYGVVLRPRNKSKRFAGADVANNQGEGLIFNSVFAFAVK